jgi:hypothetical protein
VRRDDGVAEARRRRPLVFDDRDDSAARVEEARRAAAVVAFVVLERAGRRDVQLHRPEIDEEDVVVFDREHADVVAFAFDRNEDLDSVRRPSGGSKGVQRSTDGRRPRDDGHDDAQRGPLVHAGLLTRRV